MSSPQAFLIRSADQALKEPSIQKIAIRFDERREVE
ncbi:hypothetical protein R69927_06495 [Paraburkholderia domus]|uniref:Uncharacterized protein n=1 Tax=Paraburkholderia domus TaxID=2793075 RepID=A0A9N8QWL0_9BURK|nr:hypothetical protein R69749_00581 [Paraburkholderia domus]CAE6849798.1 hypothetical protein R75483_07543 [Paraburkholderia domus]CAE6891958.1 hypothetical protein R70211_02765 [Paraburkholderia domus]CAE6919675.1 hypothetical protein R69927_06495 [Paraburkholderia domus]CAE6957657.1 hypothetical protein R70199_07076 [Paraburkholderia domus]